jgi:hypothetical protein
MGFRRQDLQIAFSVPGTDSFTVWGYGTTDTLEEVLTPNYLQHGGALVELGDLIYIRTRPRRDPVDGRQVGELRTALVMVSGVERGRPSLRLVQDFGTPDGEGCPAAGDAMATAPRSSAPREPIKRRRGRPPLRRESRDHLG